MIDKYFVRQGKFGEPNMIHFMSNWATSFSLDRRKSTKKVCKKHAIEALKNLRNKIDKAIKEIQNDTTQT